MQRPKTRLRRKTFLSTLALTLVAFTLPVPAGASTVANDAADAANADAVLLAQGNPHFRQGRDDERLDTRRSGPPSTLRPRGETRQTVRTSTPLHAGAERRIPNTQTVDGYNPALEGYEPTYERDRPPEPRTITCQACDNEVPTLQQDDLWEGSRPADAVRRFAPGLSDEPGNPGEFDGILEFDSVLDRLGITGVQEAALGVDSVTGERLTADERGRRLGPFAVFVFVLLIGVRLLMGRSRG